MNKIIIASDSFKGSASSEEINRLIEVGIHRVAPEVPVRKFSIADGGEGTVASILATVPGKEYTETVVGALGEDVLARYGIIHNDTAVIEMAANSGLHLTNPDTMNPYKTTTFGTGQLIKSALDQGVGKIYVGLGGSATNDAGVGMAQALGVSFTDESGKKVGCGAEEVARIKKVDMSGLDERLKKVPVIALSDVDNPLCGKNGASYIFGPQKGASQADVEILDKILFRFSLIIKEQLGLDYENTPGAGAAGGMGYGLLTFCKAQIKSGIEEVLSIIDIEAAMKEAALVITGEGRLDGQSLGGKAPIGVAHLAKKYQLPVIAVVGSADYSANEVYKEGIDLIVDSIIKPMPLDEAITNVETLIPIAGENAYRAFILGRKSSF